MRWFFFIIGLLLLSPSIELCAAGLAIVGVQLEIDESMYESIDSFSSAIERELGRAVAISPGERPPDLVIFPEYTSVFLALVTYTRYVAASGTVSDSLNAILTSHKELKSLNELFVMEALRVEAEMDRIWGAVARRYGVAIVAGTYFASHAGVLKNRLVVYDKTGHRFYEQDKVFLTDFELEYIGLEPGSVDDAAPFEINGFRIAPTICRDTFFSEWRRVFSGADYWIDIKANGVEFTKDIADGFFNALPERVKESGAAGGMTVCLTGSFLDLFWEGRSFVVSDDSGEIGVDLVANSYKFASLVRDTVRTGALSGR